MTQACVSTPDQVTFHGLGTEIQISIWPFAGREGAAIPALRRAVALVRRAEARLSRFRPDSDISRLNSATGKPVRVSPLTLDAIAVALEAADATSGLFDPTIYHALLAAGYDRTFPALSAKDCEATGWESRHIPSDRTQPGRYRDVEIDRGDGAVRLPCGVGLDLGGIAKGWLADMVARRLHRYGSVLADFGGDIAMRGLPPGADAWRIDLESPVGPERPLGRLRITGVGGIATSGVTRRCWQTSTGRQHHLIDPRTGTPAVTDLLSATVVGPSATAAEVAAKGVLLLGHETGRCVLETTPRMGAVLVRLDGSVLTAGAIDWQPVSRANPPSGRKTG